MLKKDSIKSFFLIVIFLIFGFFVVHQPVKDFNNIKYVEIAGQRVGVDLATNSVTQELGLSGRNELKENEGMLFVFDKIDKYTFWMKDMNFPIDMIWLSQDQKIVYIKKDARPELYPEKYTPNDNAKYVLEVTSGFSDKNNLKIGDSVKFVY